MPISVAALDTLDIEAISVPARNIIDRVSSLLPGFIGAAITIAVAVFVGRFIAKLAQEFLSGVGFDSAPEKIGLNLSSTGQTPSELGGKAVMGGIILMGLSQALPLMELGPLASHVDTFSVLFFAGGFALQHIGVSSTIVNTAFIALLGGLGVALAISFGWGGRDAAKRFLDRHVK